MQIGESTHASGSSPDDGDEDSGDDEPAWIIEIEKATDDTRVDAVCLTREDGGYDEEAKREAADDRGSYWHFAFPVGPRGRYRVEVVSAGRRYAVWKGLPLPEGDEVEVTAEDDGPVPESIFLSGCAGD